MKFTKVVAGVGAAAGALFGFAVVMFADCARPDCTYERVLGVAGHGAAGAGVGGIAGLVVDGARKLLVRR